MWAARNGHVDVCEELVRCQAPELSRSFHESLVLKGRDAGPEWKEGKWWGAPPSRRVASIGRRKQLGALGALHLFK